MAAPSIVLNLFNAQEQTQTYQEFHEIASVPSQLIEEVTAHAQSDSLEDAREICADGTYFPNNLRTSPSAMQVKNWQRTIYITEKLDVITQPEK